MPGAGLPVAPDQEERAAVGAGQYTDALQDLMAERAHVQVVTDVLHQLQHQLLAAGR